MHLFPVAERSSLLWSWAGLGVAVLWAPRSKRHVTWLVYGLRLHLHLWSLNSLRLQLEGGVGWIGRKRKEVIVLSLSGVKGSFGTCLALQHRAYIMCVWVSGVSNRCAAGIHKHPSAAGGLQLKGLVVPCSTKGQALTLLDSGHACYQYITCLKALKTTFLKQLQIWTHYFLPNLEQFGWFFSSVGKVWCHVFDLFDCISNIFITRRWQLWSLLMLQYCNLIKSQFVC